MKVTIDSRTVSLTYNKKTGKKDLIVTSQDKSRLLLKNSYENLGDAVEGWRTIKALLLGI